MALSRTSVRQWEVVLTHMRLLVLVLSPPFPLPPLPLFIMGAVMYGWVGVMCLWVGGGGGQATTSFDARC